MKTQKSLKKNDILTVEIDDITDRGFGVARHDGVVIFVSDTIPGDVAEIKIIKEESSYLIGRCEKLITKSNLRVQERCPETSCHACAYKNISYTHELRLKEDGVRRLFAPLGIECLPAIASASEKEYRNKAQYPISLTKDGYSIGFFAPYSHRVTPVETCAISHPVFSQIIDVCKSFFAKYQISVYNEISGEGLLRHIYLRRGEISCEILITIIVNGTALPHSDEFVDLIKSRFPDVVGILLNTNDKNTNIVLGDKYTVLFGRDHIFDTISGVNLKITAPSFYQVNHDTAEVLYSEAKKLAAPTKEDTVLDLFCGAGSIGLSMANDAKEIIGIEIVEDAVKCANENAKRNGITNAKFFTGDASETENLLLSAEEELGRKIKPDIIVLDPPRGGCDERLISFAASLKPKRIVYISCNPKTLARDVKSFMEKGYVSSPVLPVDMFPCTGHVESVVCLSRDKAT